MRYADTYHFAVRRVRVRWLRLLWTLAAAAEVAPFFGIAPRKRPTPCLHDWHQMNDFMARCGKCGEFADVWDVLEDYEQ